MELQNKEDSAGLILAAGRKLMVKFSSSCFMFCWLMSVRAEQAVLEVMDLGQKVAKGYFKHPVFLP